MLKPGIILLVVFLAGKPAYSEIQQLEAWWIDTGETDSTSLGTGIASLGDINEDGLNDFLVGALNEEAFVYFGSSEPDTIPRLRIPSPADSVFWFGVGLYGVGDVNGDNSHDFVISAWISEVTIDHRIAYLYFGGDILDSIPDLVIDGPVNLNSFFATNGLAIGDFNGDGGNDFILLDDQFNALNPAQGVGLVYLYYGGAALDSIPDWKIHGGNPFNNIGRDAAALGDVNDDGFDDFVIVDSQCDGPLGETDMGFMAVYYGSADPDTIADLVIYGEEENAFLGGSVAGIDFDRDDQLDIVVGSSRFYPPDHQTSIYVYLVSPEMGNQPDYIFPDQGALGYVTGGDLFGIDLNGDGWQDIGSCNSGNVLNAGEVYIYLGGADPDTLLDARYFQGNIDGRLGEGYCNPGDINGDSIDDLIVGEPGYNYYYTQNLWGQIHVILGDTAIHQSVGIIPEEHPQVPASHLLLEAYPNPFNAQVTFKVSSLGAEKTTLRIYNLKGEIVRAFEFGNGMNRITWDGRSFQGCVCVSGVYLARVSEGEVSFTKKVVLLR